MLQVYAKLMTNYYEGLTMQTIMTSLTMKCIFPLSLFWGKTRGGEEGEEHYSFYLEISKN